MSQPLKESPQTNFAQSQTTTPSKLYTILKEDNATPSSVTNSSTPLDTENTLPPSVSRSRCRHPTPRFPHEWQCWQCQRVCESEENLATHLLSCKRGDPGDTTLPGCPFCPRDVHHTSIQPFTIRAFNTHVALCHSDIAQLACAYCLEFMSSSRLEELACHVLREHHIPWRPSPDLILETALSSCEDSGIELIPGGKLSDLEYADDIMLLSEDPVLPPVSLGAHMDRCTFNGGRVYLTPLTPEMYATAAARKRTLVEAEKASREFSQSFPLVRGHPSPVKSISNQSLTKVTPAPASKKRKVGQLPTNSATPTAKKTTKPRPPPKPKSKVQVPKPVSAPTDEGTGQFDVPLSLPPPPKTDSEHLRKSTTPARLYVCPLCGDNALASLRERDEHLQASHNGELVFPCQICGLAYPLYIALRRHAALKHESDFDTVRYGKPELLETDSVECPLCKLVAFTDRAVLKLHVAEVHKKNPEEIKLPSKHGARGGSRKGSRRKSKYGDHNDGAAYAVSKNPQPVVLSRLEQLLAGVPGDPAPVSCRICHTQMDNAKEFLLHLELDHVETEEECEQLGCQACGRIFFGPGGRIDLIGHLRVCHQDTDQPDALPCLQAEKILEQEDETPTNSPKNKKTDESTKTEPVGPTRPCDATFSSPRLRQLHCSTSSEKHPGFACPLTVELSEDQELTSLTDQIRAAIMETEVAADREGLMILAYCCPNCSRLFAGSQAPSRFTLHRRMCMLEQVQPNGVTVPASTLQSVTRIEIQPTTGPAPKLTATALIKDATPVPVPASGASAVVTPSSTERIIVGAI
ncbi:unnamed protein product [Echinostoma caproni]|uniref:C2H2-type domain-containing protein n=1 Tax=Echinostoma caproni TaxID=27848 RepID=A0A183AK87_9TREM|nr:unnamed protein product [Echinostoma caproni]